MPEDTTTKAQRIGGFAIVRELGEGGMGKVYLARQESLDRNIALKVLRKDLVADAVHLERFQREARAAALFQHPHVVGVIDTGRDAETGEMYIAFEFIEGGSLEDLLKNDAALPERQALEITRAVALALAFAESRGLVHRDLKPANILLSTDGTPKLADLGLVRQLERDGAPALTQEGIIVGTPLYMAPEQALGNPQLDVRADLYSLGLCLYRMLSGRIPFVDETETCSSLAVLSRHLNEDLPDVRAAAPKVSPGAARLVAGMAARELDDRYKSANHVVADIDLLLGGQQPMGPRAQAYAARTTSGRVPGQAAGAPQAAKPAGKPGDPDATQRIDARGEPLGKTPQTEVSGDAQTVARPIEGLASLRSVAASTPPTRGGVPRVLVAVIVMVVVVGGGFAAHTLLPRDSVAVGGPTDGPSGATETPPPVTETATTVPVPVTEQGPGAQVETPVTPTSTESVVGPDPAPVTTATPDPGSVPGPDPVTPDPAPVTPVTEAPPPPVDPLIQAIVAAGGDPDRVGALVQDIGRELFLDPERGVPHVPVFVERSGWRASSPIRDRYVDVMQEVIDALRAADRPWSEREEKLRRLVAEVDRSAREPALPGALGRVVMDELDVWRRAADAVPRVRNALRDPRGEARALEAVRGLPEDRAVEADTRALLMMSTWADRPDRWTGIEDRRAEVLAAITDARTRLARTALGRLLREEVSTILAVLEHEMQEPSLGGALCALRAAGRLDMANCAWVEPRLQDLPTNLALRNLEAWAIELELAAALGQRAVITVHLDDHVFMVASNGVTVAGAFRPIDMRAVRRVVIDRSGGELVLRLPGATPERIAVPLGPAQPAATPARFEVQAQGAATLQRATLVRAPARPTDTRPPPRRPGG